ncbi:ABC transporter ATP-binding protein [Olsenella sp. Marseille-QA0557]|uniref:ABC transporter ATP-binding protein n=1 Tax=Olsenella sp. Marseille-QA0557 TaxID=3378782 RepID=UPI003D0E97F4
MESSEAQDVVFRASGLTKRYGSFTVLDKLDMELRRGRIYGFIGENGAGKTTTMRIIAGLSRPTAGAISLLGESGERGLRSARAKTGFLIEAPAVYESMTASQNLEVQCLLRGLDAASHIGVTLDLVGLRPDERRSVKHYSLGMKQRLGLAVALLGDPEFLVLDEPINGLDPAGVREIRGLLETLNRERGTTILISSHILAELSHTATDYIFLRQGHVADQFSREEFSRQRGRTFRIITSDQGTAIRFLSARFPDAVIERDVEGAIVLNARPAPAADEVRAEVESRGLEIDTLEYSDESLEDYFLAAVEGGR